MRLYLTVERVRMVMAAHPGLSQSDRVLYCSFNLLLSNLGRSGSNKSVSHPSEGICGVRMCSSVGEMLLLTLCCWALWTSCCSSSSLLLFLLFRSQSSKDSLSLQQNFFSIILVDFFSSSLFFPSEVSCFYLQLLLMYLLLTVVFRVILNFPMDLQRCS